MRALGIDWGDKRIGIALSDSAGAIATPYGTLNNSGNSEAILYDLKGLVDETSAEVIVIGLPKNLSGADSAGSLAVKERAASIQEFVGLPVELFDERLTSVTAHRSLKSVGMSERKRRNKVDQVAATVMLQAWLDSRVP